MEKRTEKNDDYSFCSPLDAPKKIRVDLSKLSKTELNNVLNEHMVNGYIIISAFQGKPDNSQFGGYEKWLKAMTENTINLHKEIRRSGYYYTLVQSEWSFGEMEEKQSVLERAFIVFNFKRLKLNSLETNLTKLKELGEKWSMQFNLSSFLYIPNRQKSEVSSIYHPAYYLNLDNQVKEIIDSQNVLTDIDIFFTLLNKEINSDYKEGVTFTYKEGILYFPVGWGSIQEAAKRTREVIAHIQKGD